jgi:hypothetical protein
VELATARPGEHSSPARAHAAHPWPEGYFVSLWPVCLRQKRQYLLNSSRSVVFFLFFVVL